VVRAKSKKETIRLGFQIRTFVRSLSSKRASKIAEREQRGIRVVERKQKKHCARKDRPEVLQRDCLSSQISIGKWKLH